MIPRYAPKEMAALFSDEARFAMWLRVELLATDGWVAVAALEPHFKKRLETLLKVSTAEEYRRAFGGASTTFWQAWGQEHDVPIETVR